MTSMTTSGAFRTRARLIWHSSQVIVSWCLLALLTGSVHTACQSSTPSDSTETDASAASEPVPATAVTSSFSPEELTQQQRRALDISQGLRDKNSDSILIAQRMFLLPLLHNALNLYYFRFGTLPEASQPLLDTLPLWPLTQEAQPWPIKTGPPAGSYPCVWLDQQSKTKPFDLVIESTEFDGVATRPFQEAFTPSWESGTGATIRKQDFGMDPGLGMMASQICSVIATYRAQLGAYPAAPVDAFETYRLGLVAPTIAAIESAYPSRIFYRSPDGKSFGLLLDGSNDQPRLFMRHHSTTGNSTIITAYGHPSAPGIQKEIDRWLSSMEVWADWNSLHAIPRVSVPRAPQASQSGIVPPTHDSPPDAASITR